MQKIEMTAASSSTLGFTFAKWSIFSVLILSYILVYFHRMAPGVVSQYLMEAFATTGAQLGTLSAIYFFVYACMQIPSGVIADTLGTRVSVISGNLVAGGGSILFGMSTSFEMACLGRFFVGLGVSVIFVSIMKSNSVWFHERNFAFMSGLTLLIGNLGSVMAAGPLAALLRGYDWRTVFIAIGVISLLLAVVGFIVVHNKPEDLGLTSPNRYKGRDQLDTTRNWRENLSNVLRAPEVWPGFWVQFGMVGSLYSFMGLWGMRYVQDVYGADRAVAALHMTVMLLCFAFGALVFGWLSDRMGRRKPIIFGCVIGYLTTWLVLMHAPLTAGLSGYLLFGMMGVFGSGFVVTFAAAKEVIHPHLSGMAVSVVNTGCFVGTALMQPLFGHIIDRSWDGTLIDGVRIYAVSDYHRGFILVLVFAVIAVLGAVRMRETNCRNIFVQSHR